MSQQTLTAETLFPEWTEQIKKDTHIILNRRLSWRYGRCIVSEALGWKSPNMFCNTCRWYADRLVNKQQRIDGDPVAIVTRKILPIIKKIDHELYERYKDAFLDHYNEKHRRTKLVDPEGRVI